MRFKERKMRSYRTKQVLALVVLLSIAGLTQASIPVALVNHDRPDLPSPLCDSLQVQAGNRLAYRAFAVGVQRYRWDGTTWVFVEPVATLFADDDYHQKVGVLSWTNLGSKQRWKSRNYQASGLHTGSDRHPLAAPANSNGQWSRVIRFG
jgi:lipopolysaccharide export system protein LptC